ncbi:MAG: molecular chaperone DnaK [Myxococcales bacterium]|nr:molecular chaperone DnaK [Myxococcales bacterium]
MAARRQVVGIDLGTTNTAVAHSAAADDAKVRPLALTQLVAPGELGTRRQLPSFLYLAGEHDLAPDATRLPWDESSRIVVGELARAQGARVPGRMIASAKSWLCHAGVDRQAAILPWGATDVPRLSPVAAQARLLEHVAHAWRHAERSELADCELVLTVPASFDEVARELTLDAATRAGLPRVTLLEEPQAVFYAWIDAHTPAERRRALAAREQVLVCDIGGGTTDFTVIRVADDGDGFERTAVGEHLLLGGDNIDVALARRVEARLTRLDATQWHGLVHACRLAKEQLFEDPSLARRTLTIAARGAKLIGGALHAEFERAEVDELVLEGFFPLVAATDRPARGRTGLAELGLPWASDAAITRHLAAFLARHDAPRIDAVLFNGGATRPAAVRARLLEQLAAWQGGARPRELVNDAPDLAVAHGAAYFGKVRLGHGTRIRGGAARAYYVGVETVAVCVLARGAEEGTEREVGEDFVALMNRPVSFRLYASTTRHDQPGARVDAAAVASELDELPPLCAVLRAPGRREARVRVHARLTELGTLELWCADAAVGELRFRLSFDLRAGGAGHGAEADPRAALACKQLTRAFSESGGLAAAVAAVVVKQLEATLDARRDEWSTATNRALFDALLALEPARARSAELEARWLNLAGFLLRPGTGAPLDDWRVRELWKQFQPGLRHERDEACRIAWWILWRRIAGGLSRGQQEQLHDRIAPLFVAGEKQKGRFHRAKPTPQEASEMWRAVASCERLPAVCKVRLGDELVARLARGKAPEVGIWALGRLGARVPLCGPVDTVVAPDIAARWLEALLALEWTNPAQVAFPAAQLARMTGDRSRDLDDELRGQLAARLRALPGGTGERSARLVEELVDLEAREERVAYGDSLPSGLRLVRE